MDLTLSNKIRIGGLCCAFIVVIRHSLNLEAFFGSANPHNLVASIELFVSKMTEMAVPYFFIISGYFFFKRDYYSIGIYVDMLKKKWNTLFVPYICWVIIGHIIMVPVGLGEFPKTPTEIVMSFWNAQCAGVLWYVRSLLLMMLLYPIYGWIFRLNNVYLYASLMVLTFLMWQPVDMRPLSTEGIFFFFAGGVIQNRHLLERYKVNNLTLFALILLWLVCTYNLSNYSIWINRFNTLIGIVVIWFALDRVKGFTYTILLRYSGMAFFLYVVHIYILKLLKFSVASFFYENQLAAFVSFLILPIVTSTTAISAGISINKSFPNIFRILTGGREYSPLKKC